MDKASWGMIELLQKDKGLSRLDAYSLASMTMDCRVGEMDAAERACIAWSPRACGRNNELKSEHKGKGSIMSYVTFMSRIAAGACGALILGTAAIAQTPAPAPAPPAQSPLGIPLTSTINTPGYPAAGPADPALRVLEMPNGKKVHVLPATLRPRSGAGSTMRNHRCCV